MSNTLYIEVSLHTHSDDTPAVLVTAHDSYDQSYSRYEPDQFYSKYRDMDEDDFIESVLDWDAIESDKSVYSSIQLEGIEAIVKLLEEEKNVQVITVTEVVGELYECKRDIAVVNVPSTGLALKQVHELLKNHLQATDNEYFDNKDTWWTSHDGYVTADFNDPKIISTLHPDFQAISRITRRNIWHVI